MPDIIVIEQCCYCGRNLSTDKLIHNANRNLFYCADADDCRVAQEHSRQQPDSPATGTGGYTHARNFAFHSKQSSCGSVLIGCCVGMGVFFGSWGYAIKTYGWFLGLSLGWIPSIFLGIMAGMFWPAALLVALGIVIFTYRG